MNWRATELWDSPIGGWRYPVINKGRTVIQANFATGQVDYSGWSRTGQVRSRNADEFVIAGDGHVTPLRRGTLPQEPVGGSASAVDQIFLVADGIGNGLGGQRASQILAERMADQALARVDGVRRTWPRERQSNGRRQVDELIHLLRICQQQMATEAGHSLDLRRMGTTVTMGFVAWPNLHIVHAGDSRAYLLRDGSLRRLTTDHTMAQQLIDAELMDPMIASNSRWKHVLYNAVTSDDPNWRPEIEQVTLHKGDTLMLCTDGLTKHVPDNRIRQLLACNRPANELTRRLVNHALADGGTDNVTVVVVKFD